MIELIESLLSPLSDPGISNLIRTLAALLAIPGALYGAYLFVRWIWGHGPDAQARATHELVLDLKSKIEAMNQNKRPDAPERIEASPSSTIQGLDEELVKRSQALSSKSISKRKAFISYALADKQLVQAIANAYEASTDITVFLDFKNIDRADDYLLRARQEIETADIFILFWSKAAFDSATVQHEWEAALYCIEAQASKGIRQIEFQIVELERDAPPLPEKLKQFRSLTGN